MVISHEQEFRHSELFLAAVATVRIMSVCCVYYTGESCFEKFELKIETDIDDITEHPHDDKPRGFNVKITHTSVQCGLSDKKLFGVMPPDSYSAVA